MKMKTHSQIDVCEMTSGSIKFMTSILEAVERFIPSKMPWINATIKHLDLHAQESKNTACKYMLTTKILQVNWAISTVEGSSVEHERAIINKQ